MGSRAIIATATVVLLVMGQSAIVAGPPPAGATRIEALTHNARSVIRAGESFTVSMRGSLGGAASFDVFGVVADVRMREARPGVYGALPAVYSGTYTVRPGDSARQAAVVAALKVGNQEIVATADRPITVDTRPPEIVTRQPAHDARLTNVRPNIVINFIDGESSVNPGAVRLLVNGRNVTADASITETSIAYNPQALLPPGRVQIELILTDRAGNTERTEWAFTITPSDELIRSVTINPTAALKPGDILTVVAAGVPAAEAWFAVDGLPEQVPMRESRTPGLYFGTYEARRGQRVLGAAIRVTLVKDGRRSTAPAATGVTIVGIAPSAPTNITTSKATVAGPRPETRIVVRGRSQPGFRVLGRLTHDGRVPSGEDQGTLQEFLARVGNDGTWQFAVGPLAILRGTKVFATLVAVDPAGQLSPPVVIELNPE